MTKYYILIFFLIGCTNGKVEVISFEVVEKNVSGIASIEEIQFYGDQAKKLQENYGVMFFNQMHYDSLGNLLIKASYNSDSSLIERIEYHYDQTLKLIEKTNYDSNGVKRIYQYSYDAKGRLEKCLDSLNTAIIEYEYSTEEGNMIIESRYNELGKVFFSRELEYDKRKFLIIENWFEKGVRSNTIRNEYDKYGNVTSIVKKNAEGELISKKSFQYEYDDKDNWVEMHSFDNADQYALFKRTIEYIEK